MSSTYKVFNKSTRRIHRRTQEHHDTTTLRLTRTEKRTETQGINIVKQAKLHDEHLNWINQAMCHHGNRAEEQNDKNQLSITIIEHEGKTETLNETNTKHEKTKNVTEH